MRLDASHQPVENFSANSPPIGHNYDVGNPVSGRQNNQGSTSAYRNVDLIDISHATNLVGTKFDSPANPIAPNGVLYEKFLDINDNTQLNRFNLDNGDPNDANDLYEKWESLAVVPVFDRAAPHDYFLFVGSDNDFITQNGFMVGQPYSDKANVDTLILVYRVTLPTYVSPHGSGKDN
jgi:hypothetical protein